MAFHTVGSLTQNASTDKKQFWKILDPFATASRRTPIH